MAKPQLDELDCAMLTKLKGKVLPTICMDPDFHETVYARIPIENYLPEISDKTEPPKDAAVMEAMTPEALDGFIDTLLANRGIFITPPDRLLSVSRTWRGRGRRQFEATVKAIPAGIVRAKGFLQMAGGVHLFNYVMGRSDLEPVVECKKMAARINRIVFIGPPQVINDLKRVDFLTELE